MPQLRNGWMRSPASAHLFAIAAPRPKLSQPHSEVGHKLAELIEQWDQQLATLLAVGHSRADPRCPAGQLPDPAGVSRRTSTSTPAAIIPSRIRSTRLVPPATKVPSGSCRRAAGSAVIDARQTRVFAPGCTAPRVDDPYHVPGA
jgi:hypothetical protein